MACLTLALKAFTRSDECHFCSYFNGQSKSYAMPVLKGDEAVPSYNVIGEKPEITGEAINA